MKLIKEKDRDLTEDISVSMKRTYLHLVLELSIDRQYGEGYRNTLGKLMKSLNLVNPIVVIA